MLVNHVKRGVLGLLYRRSLARVAANLYASYYLNSREPLLVYTSPKTGSSTVEAYLRHTVTGRPVFKAHYLSPGNLEIVGAKRRREGGPEPRILRVSKMLSRVIAANPRINWRIVTLTRDPFSRAVSALFQIIDRRHPELFDRNGHVDIDGAVELLAAQLSSFGEESTSICRWFDEELKTVFDIDVYEQPFDHEAGFMVLTRGRVKALVIRLEDLDRCLPKAVNSMTGIHISSQTFSRNVGREKKLSAAYQECRRRLKLPREVCRDICESKYVQHFYRKEEREALIKEYSQT